MTCNRYIDLIGRKLEGSLSPGELEDLTGHLATCAMCRRELVLQERINRALAHPPTDTLPTDFAARVSARAFELARAERRGRRWSYATPVVANAVVVALAVLYRADIAAALGPLFGAFGRAVGSLLHLAASGSAGVSAAAGAAGTPNTYLVGILVPLAGAFAVIILASSRIYALRRR